MARRLPTRIETQRLDLGFRHRARHPFRRIRHAAARLQALERHFLGEAQSASQSFLPLLHPRHRNHHLGRQELQVAPHLQLQADEANHHGKQMKSVWEIYPPEAWEKKFGKHPTQKPVALLERILLASTHEGDLVLDPFSGSGTTLIAAFRLRRHAVGCELSADFLTLSLRRLCSNLVQVEISVSCVQFSVDPLTDSVDRSKCVPSSLQLVQRECRFYFIGRTDRRVIFSVLADSLEDARAQFRASGHPDADALFIIKTETTVYLT